MRLIADGAVDQIQRQLLLGELLDGWSGPLALAPDRAAGSYRGQASASHVRIIGSAAEKQVQESRG